jgi:hypothetical protein
MKNIEKFEFTESQAGYKPSQKVGLHGDLPKLSQSGEF